jgi:hypothetical protein
MLIGKFFGRENGVGKSGATQAPPLYFELLGLIIFLLPPLE